ncbi:hypothetical protein C7M84_009718 [Penaeus vannamei]|uniref:Uncharacterized protein n=1 Tax=Penaeus vannamei TaxID=6689 RepID=A0A423UAB3_PENVA|nr:hypothetical protein C7M84_009718 [Penaeus vannamei]
MGPTSASLNTGSATLTTTVLAAKTRPTARLQAPLAATKGISNAKAVAASTTSSAATVSMTALPSISATSSRTAIAERTKLCATARTRTCVRERALHPPRLALCDGYYDCFGGDDEMNCGTSDAPLPSHNKVRTRTRAQTSFLRKLAKTRRH